MSTSRFVTPDQVRPDQREPQNGTGRRLVIAFLLLIFVGACVAVWDQFQQSDFLAALAIAAVTMGALNGFRRGILGLLISVVSFAVAYQFGPQFGIQLEDRVSQQLATSGMLNRTLAIGAASLALFVAFNLFSSTILRILLGKQRGAIGWNHVFGFLLGGTQAGLAILFFLGGFASLELLLPPRPDDQPQAITLNSITATQIPVLLAEQIETTKLRPVIDRLNPFVHIPQLDKLGQIQETVAALSDPNQVKRILLHPEIKQLRAEPKTKEAMQTLIRDPEVVELLRSGKPFTPAAIGILIRNEAVLGLLERPQFLEKAYQVISTQTTDTKTSTQPVSLSVESAQARPNRTK